MNNLSQNTNQVAPPRPTPEILPAAPAAPAALLPKLDLAEVFHAFRRRFWIVLACALVATLAMAAYVSTLPTLFVSQGSVHVKTEAPQVFDIKPIAQEESRDLEQMRTVADGLQTPTVLLSLVEKFELASDPEFAQGGLGETALYEIMSERVSVELRRGTRLIDISVEDTDPERATRMVEDLVTIYEEQKEVGHAELVAQVNLGLQNEEKRLRKKMEESEALVKKFRSENSVPGLSTTVDNETSGANVAMMSKELVLAKADRIRLQSEYEAFKKLDPSDPDALLGLGKTEQSELLISVQREIQAKEVAFARIQERYLHKHPVHIEAKNELESLRRSQQELVASAGETLKKRYELAVAHEEKLVSALSQEKGDALGEEAIRHSFAKLSRQAQIDRDLHASVAKRLRETKIGSSWKGSFLRWEDRPLTPETPAKPRKKLLVGASFAMGAIVGFLLAILAELLDRRVRERSAVERAIAVPALASLPRFTKEALEDLGAFGGGSSPGVGPAQLAQFSFPHEQAIARKSSMLFTSTFKNDGKSVSALKCARTFARQGYRTLLIDADFRDGGLSQQFSERLQDRLYGLAAFLKGEVTLEQTLFETGSKGLWFVPTGGVSGDHSELLSRIDVENLLGNYHTMFDRIVIDTSSVLDDAGVQSLVRHVDATTLVVRKGAGRYRDLKTAAAILRSAGAQLAGFVWNEAGPLKTGEMAQAQIKPAECGGAPLVLLKQG